MRKYAYLVLSMLVILSAYGMYSLADTTGNPAMVGQDIRSTAATSDGGAVQTGMAYSADTHNDILLLKTDSSGKVMFEKTYHRATEDVDPPYVSDEYGSYVYETYDGGYLVIGMSSVFQDGDVPYAMKTDSAGNLEWGKNIIGSEELIKAVSKTPDDGYLILSYNYLSGTYMTLKYDRDFGLEWKNPL